jgi:hypothetical protein
MRRTNLKSPAAALAAFFLAAAPLGAADQPKSYAYRADLAESTKKAEVRAGGVVWQCRAKYCVANARGGNVSVRGCTELARQVGRIVSYRSDIKLLADEQLTACNAQAMAARPAPAPARRTTTTAAASAKAAAPYRMPQVTTEELTFTGVHAPAAAGSR